MVNHLPGDYVSVYMPTTPNPTSGFFLMMPQKDVIELDMSVDEALKYIISMGVVAPADTAQRRRAAEGRRGAEAGGQPVTRAGRAISIFQSRFHMRSEYCGSINRTHLQQTVTVCGWVHRRRDHGGVIFIDLRDREGLLQMVCDPDNAGDLQDRRNAAQRIRRARRPARCAPRPDGTINANLVSGEIEVLAGEIEMLNPSLTPPFMMDDDQICRKTSASNTAFSTCAGRRCRRTCGCATAPRWRCASIWTSTASSTSRRRCSTSRRPRARASSWCRRACTTASFYALPQSPQLFKQLLMVAGFDRYYQIVKCFRDEDLRADRQPEFTQIDIETSFLDEREIQDIMEGLIRHMFKQVLDVELPPFPRMAYAEAMARYGSDKPDLRVKLELTELTDLMTTVDFKVFKQATALKDGRVAALRVPGGAALTRKEIDDYTEFVAIYGAKGLAYIKVNDVDQTERRGPAVADRQVPAAARCSAKSSRRTGAVNGDLIFFGADRAKVVNDALGALRVKIGHEKGHAEAGWRPVLGGRFSGVRVRRGSQALERRAPSVHLAEGRAYRAAARRDPGKVQAKAYDVALNGWEIGGGSVRIHRAEVQAKVFEALGISPEDARAKFGFLLDALQYGAPPHGGIAFGLDRLVTLMAGADSIREVIAFPKTQRGQDLMVERAQCGHREPVARTAHPAAPTGTQSLSGCGRRCRQCRMTNDARIAGGSAAAVGGVAAAVAGGDCAQRRAAGAAARSRVRRAAGRGAARPSQLIQRGGPFPLSARRRRFRQLRTVAAGAAARLLP